MYYKKCSIYKLVLCNLVAEVWLTGVAPLGAVSHRSYNFLVAYSMK